MIINNYWFDFEKKIRKIDLPHIKQLLVCLE